MRNGRSRPSPGLVVALIALFFALGGSAFALGGGSSRVSAYQKRCANGAVKAFAEVNGNPQQGIDNLPSAYTGQKSLFGPTFNCAGKGVMIKKATYATYDVLFPGNPGKVAVAVAKTPAVFASITRQSDGSFRLAFWGQEPQQGHLTPIPSQFMITVS
jgi:hypothetical protein